MGFILTSKEIKAIINGTRNRHLESAVEKLSFTPTILKDGSIAEFAYAEEAGVNMIEVNTKSQNLRFNAKKTPST